MGSFFERDPQHMPLGRLIALTGKKLAQHWEQVVAEHTELSRTALMALTAVAEEGELTHREVAEHCWIKPATLTPVIDALEREGLLSRQRDAADRRNVRLHITGDGKDALRESWGRVGAALREVVPEADPGEEAVSRNYLLTILGGINVKEGNRDTCG